MGQSAAGGRRSAKVCGATSGCLLLLATGAEPCKAVMGVWKWHETGFANDENVFNLVKFAARIHSLGTDTRAIR